MQWFKYVGATLLAVAGLVLFVVAYASQFRSYSCKGALSSPNGVHPETITVTVEKYRDWVRMWSDSDGTMRVEVPGMEEEYYQRIESMGYFLHIYRDSTSQEISGRFYKLEPTIHLGLDAGVFEGRCQEIED